MTVYNSKLPWQGHSLSFPVAPRVGDASTQQTQQSWEGHSPITSSLSPPATVLRHARNNSFSPQGSTSSVLGSTFARHRSHSLRNSLSSSATFAPKFISSGETQDGIARVDRIEGENDFSGKRYVWLKDTEKTFIQGWVVEERANGIVLVQCDDGTQREVEVQTVDRVNPAKFDKANDMAELTHLNEPSVIHNLNMRYQADLIYTYSGLFLVTVNPYCALPIYGRDFINMYRGMAREDSKPHIFAVADEAFRNLVDEGQNQSILVTGESGAGKTENTKKVIQYLAAVATSESPNIGRQNQGSNDLSQQILMANPILEAFGNAQTVRNNNSSRFGKFIRVQFSKSGQIAGAFIDWYLLEKSRVVKQNSKERNYHIFYQFLTGADEKLKRELLVDGMGPKDFEYTKYANDIIPGVSDQKEWKALVEAFHIIGFSAQDQNSILRSVAAVLHLGNILVMKESMRADQAAFDEKALRQAHKVCKLLGVNSELFIEALLHPRVKAGREWVQKVQTPEQVRLSIDALAKGIYERCFGDLVDRINAQLNRITSTADDTHFIGVLDIAGFEIFEENSFEQLCINYTNEKLQQFFNHHMFVLEQEEYAKEQIEWKFIDFGRDLQPTIDLIELPNPIGIFSCLDEDSVMPKATSKTFTEKLHGLWDGRSSKYRRSLLTQGFMLTHYAAEVEYDTQGWLEKNKDPLNDNVTRILAGSSNSHISGLFAECMDSEDDVIALKNRVKKGLFRTVAQRHKEQLSTLMNQLHSTHPHFVRCILPNHKKRSKLFDSSLVLDQLRCNGVLEGIRIARTGFPNRLPFAEFRARYEVLCTMMPRGYLDGQEAVRLILSKLNLDKSFYRVGLSKVFFRAGVLAELEEQRDSLIRDIVSRFQSVARGFVQRRAINKRLYREEAARIIQRNFQIYTTLQSNPWWRLFVRMRPLLGASHSSGELKKRDEMIQKLETKLQQDSCDRQKLDEERHRAETEMTKIQQTLEAERALALDKEEIFHRLQNREAELNEKLSDALEDQEALETQMDELLLEKQRAEEKVTNLRSELDRAGLLLSGLEEEKQRLLKQIEKLQDRMDHLQSDSSRTSAAEEGLRKEVQLLKSQMALKNRKIQDLECTVVKVDQDVEVKLLTATKDLQLSKKQTTQLAADNLTMRQQLAELSSTSSNYEDILRLRESELSILKKDKANFDSNRKRLEEECQKLRDQHERHFNRLTEVQAELDVTKSQMFQLEREAADAKKVLEQRLDEDAQTTNGRRILEKQIDDLKNQLYSVQNELSRERQSRDDVQMLAEHRYNTLKQDFDSLNSAKITIEKELYVQQDVLRRTSEGRNAAERERQERQDELRSLRQRFLELQEAKLEAETMAERASSRASNDRQAALHRELEEKDEVVAELDADRSRLTVEVQKLKDLISDSEIYKVHHDQHKDRLEREIVTIRGRLTASENDNRALLNKVQQKNLDIARSSSRASETQRARIAQLQAERTKHEEESRQMARDLEDAKLTIASMEKQKEKLSLGLEDLNHEVSRERQTSRNAEKLSSTMSLQLAEANRKLETEHQLRSQAQTNNRTVQVALDQMTDELKESRNQLMLLAKVFDPNIGNGQLNNFQAAKVDLSRTVDLARKLQDAETSARVTAERLARAEAQLDTLRDQHEDDLAGLDSRYNKSKRMFLEELDQSQVNSRLSPPPLRFNNENIRPFPGFSTPPPIQRHLSNTASESARSDRTVDSVSYNSKMDVVSQLELVQNQLQMSEMRNRHLQTQLERSPSKATIPDDSPSSRRVQRLERENFRLHDMLDDSSKKVSVLESSIRAGQLTLKEVRTKSHEELYDVLNSQEESRRSLLQVHNMAVAELADAKIAFEDLKRAKSSLEVDIRDNTSELEELRFQREQDDSSRAQLLQEFSDLQIKLDTETSKLLDVTTSLNLYKTRADEYYNKLEQAEIAVLRASRAEQFAKSQGREAEDACAAIMAERKHMDSTAEELQRQLQSYEERLEDMAADLDGALQSKKRLQNELEDYRSQRAGDIEDKEMSMEQTRKKYQAELSMLNGELEMEREKAVSIRSENGRLREELEDLREKWDDEVMNSSTWAKEKARLEMTLESVSTSRDEAVSAHNDAQGKVVSLLSQVRSLRTSLDDAVTDRDAVAKEKQNLEARLREAAGRLEELSRSESPAIRNAADIDREVLQLKTDLAQQEDIASTAVDKMRRSDALAQEAQKDVAAERDVNVQLHKEKATLEKTVKDLQLRLVDFETKSYSSASHDVRFLHGRIQELEKTVESLEDVRNKEQRSVRNVDRTVRDLQTQIERRDKTNAQLSDDINKSRDKMERLLQTIDELQSSDSTNQLQAKRAERELREEREKALRLERELEGWKALRMDRGEMRSGTFRAMSDIGAADSVRRRREGSATPGGGPPQLEIPQRKSSLSRTFL